MKPGDKYYDGPVQDSGRTLEEIEADIKKEKNVQKKKAVGRLRCSKSDTTGQKRPVVFLSKDA